tara:strand:+ start:3400 stop:4137 length:738 start_codon:yes stop_codon:yes gene_type:complete
MALDVTLDEVVKSLLIQQGDSTEHKYMQYLDIAIRGLKELTFDILQQVKTETLTVNDNLTVDLPKDYVNYTRIGQCKSHGRIETLGYDEYLCIQNKVDYCGDPDAHDFSGETRVSGGNSRNGELTGGWYGRGGGYRNGYYRIDREKNQIALSSELAGESIVLEYISDGSRVNGDMKVNALAEESLRAYMWWKLLQRKSNVPLGEKEAARRDWYNEKRLARARIVNFTPDQAWRISRKQVKQSPKF